MHTVKFTKRRCFLVIYVTKLSTQNIDESNTKLASMEKVLWHFVAENFNGQTLNINIKGNVIPARRLRSIMKTNQCIQNLSSDPVRKRLSRYFVSADCRQCSVSTVFGI